MITYNIPFQALELDWDNIWKECGYAGFVPDQNLEKIFLKVRGEIESVTIPVYGYSTFKNENSSADKLRLGGIEINAGPLISGFLYQAEEFVVFVASAGKEYEQYRQKVGESGDIVECFFTDLIGSAIAEHIGSILYEHINREQAAKGYKISHSYSPGYCGWPVSEQKALFSLLPQEPCDIKLTETGLMLPIKSISGIIGAGVHMRKSPHGCAICEMEHCFKKVQKLK